MSAGFIYVLVNASMPNLIKVGGSERHPQIRAEELSLASCVPRPFVVVFYLGVADWAAAEVLVHASLNEFSLNPDREFFRADASVAAKLIRLVASDLGPTLHEGTLLQADPIEQESDGECPVCAPRGRPYVLFGGQWVCRSGHE
jgi:hypothetical protein